MSRYYDPVTRRFVNADGYFQSGGDVLDANMNAYCRNNPIMFIDPSGCNVYTLAELQQNLVIGDKQKYTIKSITQAKLKGYSDNDKFTVGDDGTLIPYTTLNKIADTAGAVFLVWK